eukprot:m.362063 g.362063  ORF g.362063 m.362063 type:complete len:1194 (-) comp20076_c0_seq1:1775-5356(-)
MLPRNLKGTAIALVLVVSLAANLVFLRSRFGNGPDSTLPATQPNKDNVDVGRNAQLILEHQQLVQEHAQLQEEHKKLTRDHKQLGLEHTHLQDEHKQSLAKNALLHNELVKAQELAKPPNGKETDEGQQKKPPIKLPWKQDADDDKHQDDDDDFLTLVKKDRDEKQDAKKPELKDEEKSVLDQVRDDLQEQQQNKVALHHEQAQKNLEAKIDSKSCKPVTKLVYIKTHKTGSSTLTNIFHRFVTNYGLKAVLPKSNTFLGWPRSEGIPTSYVPLPGVKPGEYDVFCSAHTRYNRKYISDIVSDAAYVTILRETTSHFKSSWSYWGVASHIKRVSGMTATMEDLLEDPNTWFPRGLKGDRDLLHNSVAFDFGYNHEYTEKDAQDLIAHLDTFTQVLITEYMDESLVLLKRKLCWDLEDVVYYALKVNKRKPKSPLPEDIREKILKLNWFDNMLYTHFNETLWRDIAKEDGFEEEVEEFRRLKAKLSSDCAPWASWGEDQHRKALMEEDGKSLAPATRQCHLSQMDSVGYVKYLKYLSGVPDPECATQGRPKHNVVYIKTHKTGSSTLTNMLHRLSYNHNLRPILPKNNIFLGYPTASSLMSSYVKLRPKKGKDIYDVLCSAHSVYDRKLMDTLVPDAHYITVLREPAHHFMSSWKYWHVEDHTKEREGVSLTMSQFLSDTAKYDKVIGAGDRRLLHNSMAYDLGLSNDPSKEEVEALVRELNNHFALVLITEHMDESLVMLRRQLCWSKEDILYMSLKVSKESKAGGYTVDPTMRQQILKYNYADARLYQALNQTLWYRINHAIGFKDELRWLQQEKRRIYEQCHQYAAWGDDKHRKALLEEQNLEPEDEQCHLMMLDSPGFVKLLKETHGFPDPECRSPPGPKGFVVPDLGSHMHNSLANVFHRYGDARRRQVAIPVSGTEFDVSQPLSASIFKYVAKRKYGLLIGGKLPLAAETFQEVMEPYSLIPMVSSPAKSFLHVWQTRSLGKVLASKVSKTVTLEQFVSDFDSYTEFLDPTIVGELKNPLTTQLRGMFGKGSPVALAQQLIKNTPVLLIGDYMAESLVLLRRVFCMQSSDIELPTSMLQEEPSSQVSKSVEQAIVTLNAEDQKLFHQLNASFWGARYVAHEISFAPEVLELRETAQTLQQECQNHGIDVSDPQVIKEALTPGSKTPPSHVRCVKAMLSNEQFNNVNRS